MTFDIGSFTDVGRRRSGNEDSLDVIPLPEGTLCVVADGMGGHNAGEVASRLAVETMRQVFPRDGTPPEEALVGSIEQANTVILQAATEDLSRQGMGTTIVCALLRGPRAQLANVGDSPAFLVRGEKVTRLTQDHSWVAEEVARGVLSPEDAHTHPYRHILTRCLGLAPEVDVELYAPVDLDPGDVIVLGSDGLSEHVMPEDLPVAVAGRNAQAGAEHLVALANERGGSDNITVIVARWTGESHNVLRADVTTELFA
ncbi:MAG: serine/threonine-protein phosphatase [Chloroflexi bacterium]|nr:serine/threonine-protein phosphatase [Chloroflexota bacterium]